MVREVGEDHSPRWVPAEGYEDSPGVQRACYVFEWIEENLRIRLKRPDRKGSMVVPFRFNTVQKILSEEVAYCWHHKIPVRLWLPKSRQMGISTWVAALFFALAMLQPGWQGVTVAHTEAAAVEIFSKTKTFEKCLPVSLAKPVESRTAAALRWEDESALCVGSAKAGDSLGKSFTFQGIHLSEVANFADAGQDPEEMLSALTGAFTEGPDSIIVFESTAKGRDPFFFVGCEKAKDPKSQIPDRLVFLPWFLEDGYRLDYSEWRRRLLGLGKDDPGKDFIPQEDEAEVRNRVANEEVGKGEESWRYCANITDDQLVWFRQILDTKCSGKPHLRDQYYPTRYDDCWSSTSKCMFDDATIRWYRSTSRKPRLRGKVLRVDGERKIMPERDGPLRLWSEPEEAETYTIGADVGGEERSADPQTAYVVKDSTLEVVAQFHGNCPWDDYAAALYLLGEYYNNALLVVENNHNPTVAQSLHRDSYPNLYYYVDELALRGLRPKQAGFNTNKKTRPEVLNYLDLHTRNKTFVNPDAMFAQEMEWFVYVPAEKRYRATGRTRTDDRLFAAALAIYQARKYEGGATAEEQEVGGVYARFMEMKRRRAERLEMLGADGSGGMLIL